VVLLTEQEAYAEVLLSHLSAMSRRLRQLPADKWDFTFHQAAPTSRTLAQHAIQWLQCDRQHINNPDASQHRPVPEIPTEPEAICDAMDREAAEWKTPLANMTVEDLNRESRQFNFDDAPMTVRAFVAHMIQNLIYKNGQFATIYFALELDGAAPYEAPFPNPIYDEVFGIR
jgi:hypothetical protein